MTDAIHLNKGAMSHSTAVDKCLSTCLPSCGDFITSGSFPYVTTKHVSLPQRFLSSLCPAVHTNFLPLAYHTSLDSHQSFPFQAIFPPLKLEHIWREFRAKFRRDGRLAPDDIALDVEDLEVREDMLAHSAVHAISGNKEASGHGSFVGGVELDAALVIVVVVIPTS